MIRHKVPSSILDGSTLLTVRATSQVCYWPRQMVLLRLLAALVLGVTVGCTVDKAPVDKAPACPTGLEPYKGSCMSRTAINFVSCTETRGRNTSEEEQGKIDAAVSTAAKVAGAEGSV